MADVVYLHVGAPKTGTTYLQDRLHLNRETLAEHGISYPVGPRGVMFAAAVDLIDLPWGGQRESVRGEWDALMGRVRRASGTAVVSHEILAGATRAQVARAMDDLAGAEVHLVYSARDLARQIPAEWQESVKHQSRRSFAAFLRRVRKAERRDATVWFWRAQGLPDVLNRWASGLPADRVHLVTVPQPNAAPGELWRRYCTAFGIDPAWAPQDSDRVNSSIGIDEIALLRELNHRLRLAGIGGDDYRAIVRSRLVHETLAQRQDMRRVTLPPRAYDWVTLVAEEWTEWVRQAGIDVVGELDDLCPVRPEPGTKWRNPDKARPRKVADAATDALVAAVMEAAARPAPEAPAAPMLTRAARRLRGQ